MPTLRRLAPFALLSLPVISHAQVGAASSIGLEIPAPAPPSKGHFLTGAYVLGAYSPLPTTGTYGYGIQPFLRYQLGSSDKGRPRPYVQYSFAPYRIQTYRAGSIYGSEAAFLPVNPGFAPLASRNVPYGYPYASSYGDLGAFSVGIPMHIGSGSAVLNVGGSIVGGLLGGGFR